MEKWSIGVKKKKARKVTLLTLPFLQGKDISNGTHNFGHLFSKFNTGSFKRLTFKYPLSYYTTKNKSRIFWAVVSKAVV